MLKQKINAIIITGTATLLLGLLVFAALMVSANYNAANGFPKAPQSGVMDMSGYSLIENPNGTTTAGEWEFFYNKWIVTDNLTEAEPDCILNLPDCWTGKKTASGEIMKRNAYGSFRLTLINMQECRAFYVEGVYPASTRFFVNGQLCAFSGEMSKTNEGGFVSSPSFDEKITHTIEGGATLEIVVEMSYNNHGGVNFVPWMSDDSQKSGNSGASFINFTSLFMPGLVFGFVIFSFSMSIGNKKGLKNLSFPLFVLIAFIQLMTTPETYTMFVPHLSFLNFSFAYDVCLLMFFILPAVFLAHLILHKVIKLKKYELALFCGANCILLTLFYVLWGTTFQFITLLLLTAAYLYIFYKLSVELTRKKPYSLFYLSMMIPLLLILLLVPLDLFGVLVYPLYPIFSVLLFVIATIFTGMSYKITRDNAKRALQAADLEMQNAILESEIGKVKQQALQAQIKPHFIFNALSSIQALYDKDKRTGNNALDMFASHLRQNVDSRIHDTITFEQEIVNIQNYVELENLRLGGKLTLLFDIEYTDFEIPALSLQPFVENAIKYAGTQNTEDGYILIESKLIDNTIIIKVCDNGKGFDINTIRETAVGLKNCTERLRLIIGAETEIKSANAEGTTVTIKIPSKEQA